MMKPIESIKQSLSLLEKAFPGSHKQPAYQLALSQCSLIKLQANDMNDFVSLAENKLIL